jgi:hypothetical protein
MHSKGARLFFSGYVIPLMSNVHKKNLIDLKVLEHKEKGGDYGACRGNNESEIYKKIPG